MSPVLAHTRFQGTYATNGWSLVSASGPFVIVSKRNSTGTFFSLYKRINGVLQEVLPWYTPTLYPPDWGLAYWGQIHDCYYQKELGKLQIMVSARHAYSNKGAVYFLEWPENGTQNSDMVELGEIQGEYTNQKLAWTVAICNDWAMAVSQTAQVTFYSRSGGSWGQDKRSTYTGMTPDGRRGCDLWPHPSGTGVLGVLGQPAYNPNYGRITVVRSLAPGVWEDLVTYDGASSGEYLGGDCAIGIGLGNGTIAASSGEPPNRGIRIFDRIADDDWSNRGKVKDSLGGSLAGGSISVGYKVITFGNNGYTIQGKNWAGAWNIAHALGPSGDWPINENAQYFEYPSDIIAGEYHTEGQSCRVAYEPNMVRFLCSSWGWDGQNGSFVEYEGDDLFPASPPPEVSNQSPVCGSKNVNPLSDLEGDITDPDGDLETSSIRIYVNEVIVWRNGAAVNGWSGFLTSITDGVHYTLVPPVAYHTPTVVVRVYAEDLFGSILDQLCEFYPSVDLSLVPIVLAHRLLKISFESPIAANSEALDKNNYTVTVHGSSEEVEVHQVLYDPDDDALDYVSLYLGWPVLGTDYQVEATNLSYAETGSLVGNATGRFTAVKTKVDSLVSNMSNLFDTSINSKLFHLLAAIGLSDEEIGGERIITTLVSIETAEVGEATTYGTFTYGTDTYGG